MMLTTAPTRFAWKLAERFELMSAIGRKRTFHASDSCPLPRLPLYARPSDGWWPGGSRNEAARLGGREARPRRAFLPFGSSCRRPDDAASA